MDLTTLRQLSWAAGVLDAQGRFKIRIKDRENVDKREAYATTVSAVVGTDEAAHGLVEVLGGGVVEKSSIGGVPRWRWWVPAEAQLDVLSRVAPFLKSRALREQAGRVIFFRLACADLKPGEGNPVSVLEARRRLARLDAMVDKAGEV